MIPHSPKHFFCLTALFLLLSASLIASGSDAPAQDASGLFLSGTTFRDTDGDGFFSPGEGALANARVRLILEGTEISNTSTNESGQYSFGNLSPGRYELIADPFSGWSQTTPGSGRYEVTLSDKPGFGLDYGFFAPQDRASPPAREYPIMHPTKDEADLWAGQYNASDRAYLSPEIATRMAAAPVTSFNLLDRLKYIPSERDQGSCGNMSYPQEDSLSHTVSTNGPQGEPERSEALAVTIAGANSQPATPDMPRGSRTGILQKSYNYTASATDPDGDDLQITFDWGDASTSQTEMVNSGTTVRMPHTWSSAGTYLVRVMATDRNDAVSLRSAAKTVKVYDVSRRKTTKSSDVAKAGKTGQGRKACPCSGKS